MAETATGQTVPASNAQLGVALLKGRILSPRPRKFQDRNGSTVYATLILLPAADEYASASTVEVWSDQPIGAKDEPFVGKVRLSGSARGFSYTDKNTGEQVRGTEVRHYLHLV